MLTLPRNDHTNDNGPEKTTLEYDMPLKDMTSIAQVSITTNIWSYAVISLLLHEKMIKAKRFISHREKIHLSNLPGINPLAFIALTV